MPCGTCEKMRRHLLPAGIADKLRQYEAKVEARRLRRTAQDPRQKPPEPPKGK